MAGSEPASTSRRTSAATPGWVAGWRSRKSRAAREPRSARRRISWMRALAGENDASSASAAVAGSEPASARRTITAAQALPSFDAGPPNATGSRRITSSSA